MFSFYMLLTTAAFYTTNAAFSEQEFFCRDLFTLSRQTLSLISFILSIKDGESRLFRGGDPAAAGCTWIQKYSQTKTAGIQERWDNILNRFSSIGAFVQHVIFMLCDIRCLKVVLSCFKSPSDLDQLIRHEKSKSHSSTDWTSPTSHSSSSRSPPALIKEKGEQSLLPHAVHFHMTFLNMLQNLFLPQFS